MNDSYVEYSVKSKPEKNYYIGVVSGVLCMILGIFFLLFYMIGFVLFLIGLYLIIYFGKAKNIEYEYIITNGSFEISAIYNASRRKLKKQFDATLVKMICPGDSNRISGQQFAKKYDFTSKKKDADCVAVVIEHGEKSELVRMELNDKCIDHLKCYHRNKVYDI